MLLRRLRNVVRSQHTGKAVRTASGEFTGAILSVFRRNQRHRSRLGGARHNPARKNWPPAFYDVIRFVKMMESDKTIFSSGDFSHD